MGVPTDLAKSTRQSLARFWALAFYDHQSLPDGIIYPSRHTNMPSWGVRSSSWRQPGSYR
nr:MULTISPECIES: hypothetical protein [Neorhizobium]